MRVTSQITFEGEELRAMANAFNAVGIIFTHNDIAEFLRAEGIEDFDRAERVANSCRLPGNEISAAQLQRAATVLVAIHNSCMRDLKIGFGLPDHTRVIHEAREQQKIDATFGLYVIHAAQVLLKGSEIRSIDENEILTAAQNESGLTFNGSRAFQSQ